MKSKVLVTGSSGFIGKALCTKLKSQQIEVIEFSGDICDSNSIQKLNNTNISHCFHLAAKTFVPDSWLHPATFIKTNVSGTQNILNLCKNKNASLTYISAYLYGAPKEIPISENTPLNPNNPYALSKYLAEQLCSFYALAYNLNISVIRPFNVYGPGQEGKFLIPSIIRQAIHEKEIKVKDLSPKRDYVFIDDLIDAMIASMFKKKEYAVYNVASGTSYSVKEVIDAIQQVSKTDLKIISENTERANEIPDTLANIDHIKNELAWHPRHSFTEGIAKIISCFQ